MNVLLTCAGRRNYLVEYFKQAVGARGRVLAADQSPSAPALQAADEAYVMPGVFDPGYVEQLLTICKSRQVGLVIPLNDLELPVLAENKARFCSESIIVVVSDAAVVNTCFDKYQTLAFAQKNGIVVPPSYFSPLEARQALDSGALAFPLVVKPRWGSASFGVEVCYDEDELTHVFELAKKRLVRSFVAKLSTNMEQCLLIQPIISGQEYGLDVVNDLAGRHVCTFVKKKLAMRSGETDKAVSIEYPELFEIGRNIGMRLGHVGNLDLDVCGDDNGLFLIDMNPRFGGGYPFSHMAGANVPAALLAWAEGKQPDPSWLTISPGVTASKYSKLITVK
ncbi:MAG: ATP-grasp domain-containing protein [Smithellaceae bacterium]